MADCANATLSPPPLRLLQLVFPSSTSPRTHLPMLPATITRVAPTPRCRHHHYGNSNWFSPPPLSPAHICQSANWFSPIPLSDSNQRRTITYNLRDHNPTPRRCYHHYPLLPFSQFLIFVINTEVIPEPNNGGDESGERARKMLLRPDTRVVGHGYGNGGFGVPECGDRFDEVEGEAIVYPLNVRVGEKPVLEKSITFFEMYKKKKSKDLELARLKNLAKEKQLN
ncbi:Flavanone 3-hydroxylase [Abeliophyllum distichum]|uniref:Flavanone 3-hydroxylase n=1 Tax=Abeliophyllum distichum TaxID=126358 RepID=A0ABD1SUR7_9LAMI